MIDKKANSHDFWLQTCGLDTYYRSAGHARVDTPWNAFTSDDRALVCTLWADRIATVIDPVDGCVRRFVRLGGKSRQWKGVAKMHGDDAKNNLERAIKLSKPVFGYEAEPQPAALQAGERKVKHFYLNRLSQLHGWIGLRLDDLMERLNIDNAFEKLGIEKDIDVNTPATLFELVKTTAEIPVFQVKETEIDAISITESDTAEAEAATEPESEEDLVNQEIEGNLSTDEYARLTLPILIEHVLRQTDNVMRLITYRELAAMLGRHNKHGDPWPRGLGQVLGRVTELIEHATAQRMERPPFLTCVVVLSSGPNAGLPGAGVSNEWPGYGSLPRKDKKAKLMNEYERVLSYGSRWNGILRLAGLPEVALGPNRGQLRAGGWGGGESEPHKILKRFVLEHPEICGAPEDCWLRETEHALRSGDGIDVMFKSDRLWVGVEVKSRVSDGNLEDYLRGLYQVVKYRAVLEAQAQVDHPDNPPVVRVFLVLEGRLPDTHRDLAKTLGVQYFEKVTPVVTEVA